MKFTLNKKRFAWLIIGAVIFGILAPIAISLTAGEKWGYERVNKNFTKRVWIDSTLNVDGLTTLADIIAAASGKIRVPATFDTVSLTSPTTTFSVSGKGTFIQITSNANLTDVTPINGTLNQIYLFRSGSGTNTIRFDDDGTTMNLGGNITLTEGQGDYMALRCTDADNGYFDCVFAHDN